MSQPRVGNAVTIAEAARQIGVSRQAVYSRLKRDNELSTRLQDHLSTVDNVLYIDADGVDKLKAAFIAKTNKEAVNTFTAVDSKQVVNEVSTVDSMFTGIVDRLTAELTANREATEVAEQLHRQEIEELKAEHKAEVEDLRQQLDQARRELAEERQHSRDIAERLAVLADQAQRLHLVAQVQQPPAIQTDDDKQSDGTQEQPTIPKKSFFRRLFDKDS